jgi:hypothetical protein
MAKKSGGVVWYGEAKVMHCLALLLKVPHKHGGIEWVQKRRRPTSFSKGKREGRKKKKKKKWVEGVSCKGTV